jgi:hypothetical protein
VNVLTPRAGVGLRARALQVAGLPYGRALVLAILYGYLTWLVALGGQSQWGQLWVPALQPSFLDLHSVTSAWECTRKGIEVIESNPCDYGQRPANYPRLWLLPSALGLGQGVTIALGIAIAILFLGSFLLLVRGATVGEGIVYGAALVSPAVMLGVERGNVDILMFALLVFALLAFRLRAFEGRVAGHAMLLLAGMLKLFPVLAWGVLLRQTRRWRIAGTGIVVAAFSVYVLVTLDDIRTILRVIPQVLGFSYGADIGVIAVRTWLSHHVWGALANPTVGRATIDTCVLLACALALALAWRRRDVGRPMPDERSTALDAFVAGAGIFVGSFALLHNWDYRLAFLLLTLPQLVRWAGASTSPVPAPRLTLAAVLGTLWLSEWLSGNYPALPLEEALNWLIFITLGTGLIVVLGSAQLERLPSRIASRVLASGPRT